MKWMRYTLFLTVGVCHSYKLLPPGKNKDGQFAEVKAVPETENSFA